MNRVISWFSCGAASAVATKLAIVESKTPVEVVYCHVKEEHPDNLRFMRDCEQWFGRKILVLYSYIDSIPVFDIVTMHKIGYKSFAKLFEIHNLMNQFIINFVISTN